MQTLDDGILTACIDKWGAYEQLHQAMGECGEFVAVAQNYYRTLKFGSRNTTIEEFMSEVVDVVFMMQQMRIIDPKLYDEIFEQKKQSLLKRLAK
jgi:hypothetical protein